MLEGTMKKRKYAYMIVGGKTHLMIGMELKRGDDHVRVSSRISWADIEAAKVDVAEVNLDIMECQLDRRFNDIPTFEEIFGKPAEPL